MYIYLDIYLYLHIYLDIYLSYVYIYMAWSFLQSDTYKANSVHNRIVISEFGTLALPDPCRNVFERFMSKFELPGKWLLMCLEFARDTVDYLNCYDI